MMRNILLLAILVITVFSSCVRQRDIVYMQDIDSAINNGEILEVKDTIYKIQINDILYVKVFSFNDEITRLFNVEPPNATRNFWISETNVYLNGFSVNDSGLIALPIVGSLYVKDKTIIEIQKAVQEKMDKLIKDGIVVVKLISFDVSVIGEIARPGFYKFYRNSLNVLEMIAKAGGITDYADKKHVLVLRPTSAGFTPFYLDLTSKDLITSKGFKLMPNDIVYVKPQKNKAFRLSSPSISLILASLSTIILILNFINK